jgi:hypothetical protein
MLADELDYVIGVDTHRDQHTLAVVAAATGAVLAQSVVHARARGYADALRFATRDYIERRVAEGKSARDATRILKRYLARHLYRVMQKAAPAMT